MSSLKVMAEQQIIDFNTKFRNRFKQLIIPNDPNTKGFTTKLNRQQDATITLNIYIFDKFPQVPPTIVITPKLQDEIIDQNGRVIDDCIRQWTLSSSLVDCVGIILSKLEGSKPPVIDNNQQYLTEDEDKALINELKDDLQKKSLEELIYINFNPEHYISKYTQKGIEINETLLAQVMELNKTYESKKSQYAMIKDNIEKCKVQYEEKENELNELLKQKQTIDNQMSVPAIIEELKQYTEINFNRPRQQLANDFQAKRIDFETFKSRYKDLSLKYHYYSLIKDKLCLCK